MRTSRNAWGVSLRSDDAATEWELGSRVMNDLEVENNRWTGAGALSMRAQRAQMTGPTEYADTDELMDCIVTVTGRPEGHLYFVYDAIDDGVLLAHQVSPPLPKGQNDVCLIPIEDIEDWVQWDEYTKEDKS